MSDLFSIVDPVFDHGAKARDAIARVAENAGDRFLDLAAEFVLAYLAKHGPAAGETMTDACLAAGIKPAKGDGRAFGPVYMRLAKEGKIERAGVVKRAKGNGSPGYVWCLKT